MTSKLGWPGISDEISLTNNNTCWNDSNKHRIVEKEKKEGPRWVIETQYEKKWTNNRNNNNCYV